MRPGSHPGIHAKNMKHYLPLFLMLLLGTVHAQTRIESVIAVVEGHAITQIELEDEFRIAALIGTPYPPKPTISDKRAVLDTLIARKFALLEAARIGVVKSDENAAAQPTSDSNYSEQVTAQIQAIAAKFPSEAEFSRVLQENGLEVVSVEAWVYARLVADALFRRKFVRTVNADEIEEMALDYFERHPDEFKDADGNQREYAEVEEKLLGRFRQQKAKIDFEAWLTELKNEGNWLILDAELARANLNPPTDDEEDD